MNSKDFWDARYSQNPESWGEEPNQFLREVDLKGLSSAVDLAGGNGRNSLWLASQGLSVENIDISSVALDQFMLRAELQGLENRCLRNESDALQAKFSFAPDLLLVAYLQIPSDQLQRALKNALEQLNGGARVLGVWHAVENLEEGFGGPQDESVLVSAVQLEQFAESYSWAELNIQNRQRVVPTEDGDRVAIDVVLFGQLEV